MLPALSDGVGLGNASGSTTSTPPLLYEKTTGPLIRDIRQGRPDYYILANFIEHSVHYEPVGTSNLPTSP